MSKFRSFRGSK
jgi:hypothetical protein